MKLETGHPVTGDAKPIDGQIVRFIAEDGRCMFEVSVNKDGRSIEVRAVELYKVKDRLYEARIMIEPHVSNSITIRTPRYEVTDK